MAGGRRHLADVQPEPAQQQTTKPLKEFAEVFSIFAGFIQAFIIQIIQIFIFEIQVYITKAGFKP